MKMSAKSKIYAINKIINSKFDKVTKRWSFLVRWKGYAKVDDTWEPMANLRMCQGLVKAYLTNKRRPKPDMKPTKRADKLKDPIASVNKKRRRSEGNNTIAKNNTKTNRSKNVKRKSTSTTVIKKKVLNTKGGLGVAMSDNDDDVLYSLNVKECDTVADKIQVKTVTAVRDEEMRVGCADESPAGVTGETFTTPTVSSINSTPIKVSPIKDTPIKDKPFTPLLGPIYASPYVPSRSTIPAFPLSIADIPDTLPTMPSSPMYSTFDPSVFNVAPKQRTKQNDSDNDDEDDEKIERRTSVRQRECAFRYKNIAVKKCPRYTQVWLNTQTQQKNALNPSVIEELVSVLNAAKFDDTCLVMLGALSGVFCSGVDLHFLLAGDRKVSALKMVDAVRDLCKTLITFPKPVVAVVTGPAIGLGTAILPLCDVVYASDKATFNLPYARLMQTPEGCASFTLPTILGLAMANDMLMGGRKITATEAHQLGLVSRVLWPTSMMEEMIPYIDKMTLNSAKAMATTKLLIRSHQRTKLELTNESECNLLLDRWTSSECRKAMQEYVESDVECLS